ncbi:muscle-related coiled-coil protein-like [Notothenia coriiceps]|uniref:Muscle-restricted coiled-coil protein n=1 Tax=Notothenia coriiceps TaxID=8208 RepID=A0A6I9MXC9_9TELE|nr:PREDICTED: muscle-related coiled-coil protein-like [Notothenia coriiceps]
MAFLYIHFVLTVFRLLSSPQGEAEIPSVAVTKSPKGTGLDGVEVEPDIYDVPADLSSDEEYLSVDEADPSRATRMKQSMVKSSETLKAAFSKENMSKTRGNLGTKFHNLGEKVMPHERRDKMHQAGERLKQSGERLKDNIAKKAPSRETFRIKLKKERAVAEGQEGAEAETEGETEAEAEAKVPAEEKPVAYTEVAMETKREGPVEEAGATRIPEDEYTK